MDDSQDQLRKQLDSLKTEVSRKNSSELESSLKEKEEIIAQLHEEGEKLARQELQHSTIIKKLRAKEKDNEQIIKGLRWVWFNKLIIHKKGREIRKELYVIPKWISTQH